MHGISSHHLKMSRSLNKISEEVIDLDYCKAELPAFVAFRIYQNVTNIMMS